MNCATNIITANFSGGKTHATTARVYQWSRGIELCITGADNLPQTFKAHFSVQKRGGVATTIVGIDERVEVPNVPFTIGKDIHVWLGASETEDDAEILYTVDIPVSPAPMPEYYDAEDTGVFDAVVEQVSGYASTATAAANSAGASATAAAASASSAAGSAAAAEQARADAVTAKGQAETAAQTATEKAQQTAQNASQAASDAGRAESAAERAETAETGAGAAKTAAEAAAQSAAASESAASASATSAGQSANAAAQSASAAAQSAASIEGDVQTATQKANEATTAAGQAVTAKDAAVTAQTAAETAATNAGQSASTASAKAAEAAQSASGAAQSKTDAEAAAARAEQAAASLTVDTALSDSSTNPVQNKVITGELTDVKNAINYRYVNPVNWLNPNAVTDGILKANGTVEASDARIYTDYIPVKPGDVIRQYYNTGTLYRRNICAYSIDKTVKPSDGSDSASTGSYTVPDGVYFVRYTLDKAYLNRSMITINTVPTSYNAYFAPYIVYDTDLLTPASKEKLDGIPEDSVNEAVKGTNLIPTSQNGTGAYAVQGGAIKFFPNYTAYHYSIMQVKPQTRYYVNFGPSWWILADDNDNIVGSGTAFVPSTKKYIDTGNATRFYYTISNSTWDIGVIVSKGVTGVPYGLRKPGFLSGLNQLMFDGWYALALPKNNKIRFTKNLAEKFYYLNMLSLPDKNMVSLIMYTYHTREDDGVLINPSTAGNFNNYLYNVYDDNLSVVEQNVNGMYGTISEDNVQDCSVLLIGDSTIASGNIGQGLIDGFASRGKSVTLLGSLGTGNNKHEGRGGWSARGYCSVESSGGVTNPFYNPTTQAFDFSYYMTNQGYASVDFVVIQLGINDLYNPNLYKAKEAVSTLINDMFEIITSIKAFNANQKILLNLPTPCTSDRTVIPLILQKAIRAKFIYYNAQMLVLHTNFADTRCSHCNLILDPATDIIDNIHPNASGYSKMALEILSQINCWQNGN